MLIRFKNFSICLRTSVCPGVFEGGRKCHGSFRRSKSIATVHGLPTYGAVVHPESYDTGGLSRSIARAYRNRRSSGARSPGTAGVRTQLRFAFKQLPLRVEGCCKAVLYKLPGNLKVTFVIYGTRKMRSRCAPRGRVGRRALQPDHAPCRSPAHLDINSKAGILRNSTVGSQSRIPGPAWQLRKRR